MPGAADDPAGEPLDAPVLIRVLIADDHARFRAALAAVLSSAPDIEVVGEVSDGVQAVDATRRLRPDVVLMDVEMAAGDGVEATRRITRPGPPGPTAPLGTTPHSAAVLMLTAHGDSDTVQRALRAGASGFLSKFCARSELLAAVRAVVIGMPALSSDVMRLVLDDFTRGPGEVGVSPDLVDQLSPRELEVLALIAQNRSNAQIAAELWLQEGTVKTHVHSIFRKLGAENRTHAAIIAINHGLVRRPEH